MFRTNLIASLAAAAAALLTVAPASAQVLTVFLEDDAAGGIASPFLNTVASDGTTAYAVSNGQGSAVGNAVVLFSSGIFAPIMSDTEWNASPATSEIFASEGAGVVGNSLRFVHFLENAVYEVDLTSGAATEVVSTGTFGAALPGSVNLVGQFEVTSDGTIYGINSPTDTLYAVSAGNAVSVEIADLVATIGGDAIRGVGVLGSTVLLGDNDTDTLWAWDTATDTASPVLTAADIDPLTSDVDGVVGFGDVFAAPNGLVYFYESDGDDLLAYDPADPVGTLRTVISTAEFAAGPSSDTINQLSWFEGNIAFTDGSIGYFTYIPEPTSAMLGLLAVAGLAARRR